MSTATPAGGSLPTDSLFDGAGFQNFGGNGQGVLGAAQRKRSLPIISADQAIAKYDAVAVLDPVQLVVAVLTRLAQRKFGLFGKNAATSFLEGHTPRLSIVDTVGRANARIDTVEAFPDCENAAQILRLAVEQAQTVPAVVSDHCDIDVFLDAGRLSLRHPPLGEGRPRKQHRGKKNAGCDPGR